MARQMSQTISRRDFLMWAGGLLASCAFPGLAHAGELNQSLRVIEGDIADSDRITLEGALASQEVEYLVRYLPSECAEYRGKLYQVEPKTIWWHWDGGPTPITEDHDRVQTTWRGLLSRTKRADPVAAHLSVGPNTVLQMLPLRAAMILQGRLTNDTGIDDIDQTRTLGGIQIETTGRCYKDSPPLECQTATLVDLTIAVMKQYHVPFPEICGHRERAPGLGKSDPGAKYLKETRIRLLKALIAQGQWSLVGHPDQWDFHAEVLKGGKVRQVLNQPEEEIWSRLTEEEKRLIHRYVVES